MSAYFFIIDITIYPRLSCIFETFVFNVCNKAKNFDRENTAKLNKAREIYNQSKGLQNISEHQLKKFNEIMKYLP